jgi:hypothetical protein
VPLEWSLKRRVGRLFRVSTPATGVIISCDLVTSDSVSTDSGKSTSGCARVTGTEHSKRACSASRLRDSGPRSGHYSVSRHCHHLRESVVIACVKEQASSSAPCFARLMNVRECRRSDRTGRRRGLLLRSRKQHPARTCKLSVDVLHLRIHVQGRPWSYVAVDVPTDVDRGGSSVAGSGGLSAAAKHLILGQELEGCVHCAVSPVLSVAGLVRARVESSQSGSGVSRVGCRV